MVHLRCVLGYFTNVPLDKIPNVAIPLHTLIELRPKPDGSMEVSVCMLDDIMDTLPCCK